jgi:hypothetical protein
VADHLNGLAVERKTAFGGLLELITIWPACMLLPGRQMQIPTHCPHSGSFLLCLGQAPPQRRAQRDQCIDVHGFHDESLQIIHTREQLHGALLFGGQENGTTSVRRCVLWSCPKADWVLSSGSRVSMYVVLGRVGCYSRSC